tara:strand:+ start:1210 stop:1371 length:162 start_codon:yes stop_codon:yes gene_type:complete
MQGRAADGALLGVAVQINAGTEALDGEEFGDDNFDFDDVAEEDEMGIVPERDL